jgi:hypothetical protein
MSEQPKTVGPEPIVMPVKLGDGTIFDVERKALKIAFLTGSDVTFKFNDQSHILTPDQAREVLTPDSLRATLARRQDEITSIQQSADRQIAQTRAEIAEETDFARKAFPTEFPQEQTTE